jgi:hypothetical protein
MNSSQPPASAVIDPQEIGVVWIDAAGAAIATWGDGPEPTVEHIVSGVTPKRRAVGSVRRGPARPSGGGSVAGHGTEEKHERELREFFAEVAGRVANLDIIEVIGRGYPHEGFAELLGRIAARRNETTHISVQTLSRRPSDAQLKARLRKASGTELPRRRVGRYRLPTIEPATATGRPLRPAAGRRTLRPARLPEAKHIAEEIELMLASRPSDVE